MADDDYEEDEAPRRSSTRRKQAAAKVPEKGQGCLVKALELFFTVLMNKLGGIIVTVVAVIVGLDVLATMVPFIKALTGPFPLTRAIFGGLIQAILPLALILGVGFLLLVLFQRRKEIAPHVATLAGKAKASRADDAEIARRRSKLRGGSQGETVEPADDGYPPFRMPDDWEATPPPEDSRAARAAERRRRLG